MVREIVIQVFFLKVYFMCMSVRLACMYIPGAHRSQKRTLDLELQVFMSHHVGAWNRTLVSCSSNKRSYLRRQLSSLERQKVLSGL